MFLQDVVLDDTRIAREISGWPGITLPPPIHILWGVSLVDHWEL